MRQKQQGVALVLVLWVITLLSVIAGNFAFSMRSEAIMARNQLSIAQAKTRADAGVNKAWFELLRPESDLTRWSANGIDHTIEMDGALVQVSIQDEFGKIDINTGAEPLIRGLFLAAGMPEDALNELVTKLRLPNRPHFTVVDELRSMAGITAEVYGRVAPNLTVYSAQKGISTQHAPKEVLLSIPGVNPAVVDQYVARRLELAIAGQPVPIFESAGAFSFSAQGLSAYTVRSIAIMQDGAKFARQSTFRLGSDPKRMIHVIEWREIFDQNPTLVNSKINVPANDSI
jgi:general secretion pathway protein K